MYDKQAKFGDESLSEKANKVLVDTNAISGRRLEMMSRCLL